MELQVNYFNNYSIVCLEGQFLNTKQMKVINDIVDELFNSDKKNIVLDFKKISYISSLVIAYLIRLCLDLSEQNGKLAITNVNDSIQEVFNITKVGYIH